MADGAGGEHRVQIAANGAAQGKVLAAPEKQLNCFVRCVALIERMGNALGTLAFTWATVVLLGGYPTVLRPHDDFWIATAIVFLEAARMFSSNNRLDYRLFFRTRGAFRLLGLNGLITVACFSDMLVCMILWKVEYWIALVRMSSLFMAILLANGMFLSSGAVGLLIGNPLRRAISLWSPMVAILLLGPSVAEHYYDHKIHRFIFKNQTAKWTAYLALLVAVLLLTISRLRFPIIIRLVDGALGSKHVFCRRVFLNLCMFTAIVMSVFMLDGYRRFVVIPLDIYALAIVSFVGNFQFPVAVVRVTLALARLISHNYGVNGDDEQDDATINLASSLNIFYGIVLGQGMLYIVACMLEVFSFFPRRSLVRHGGFRGQWGVESVGLYHIYAFDKCMEGAMLAPKKISLICFAMDSLNSDSRKKQFCGIRMMHSFLQREPTKTQLLSKLTTSTKTMARLINMLDWTGPKDAAIRLFAAKVTVELAKNLRVVTIPGTIHLVSTLLDADNKRKRGNPLLGAGDEQGEIQDPTLNAADNQEERHDPIPNTDNLLETQTPSAHQVGTAA